MRKSTTAALLLAGLVASSGAWAVNKCTGTDGKVSFQDAPCTGGTAERVNVRPALASTDRTGAADAQAELARIKHANAMSEAIRTRTPLVGMTEAQLRDAMGTPTQVNANNYSGTQKNQVIFERSDETWLVYTTNGIVESIQHRPRAGNAVGGSDLRPVVSCPTHHEIQSAMTSASSISLSDREKAERWRAIREMQNCGKR